jgi:anti-anti-sigma factor
MKLLTVSSEPGLTRLASTGDITLADFQGGANPLEPVLGADGFGGTVLLDLAKSHYIDSTAVGWLIQCHARCQRSGGRLVLHSIAPMVNHCFRVLGMYDVLHIVADEDAALKLAGEPVA